MEKINSSENLVIGDWGLGIGDWGDWGFGDWGLAQSPSPIPNPQSPIPIFQNFKFYYEVFKNLLKFIFYLSFII